MTTTPSRTGTPHKNAPLHTGSKATRTIGIASLAFLALFLLFALVLSPPEVTQGESIRLFYIHVPSAVISLYFAFGLTAFGGVMYLWKQSQFWDLVAWASAEIGVLFCAFTLVTGMLWGRLTWGTYWEWDPRLTATAISFVLFLAYLAVRRLDIDPVARSRRAAVLGIIGALNTVIVRFSVSWWKGLHQGTTLDPVDAQIDGLHLFSFFLGFVTLNLIFVWLLIHRFRVGWLEVQVGDVDLDQAIAERRAEGVSQ